MALRASFSILLRGSWLSPLDAAGRCPPVYTHLHVGVFTRTLPLRRRDHHFHARHPVGRLSANLVLT
jgi:hypothetical protein